MEILIILGFAGYTDYKTREIPTEIVLILYLCAFLYSSASVPERIAGFLLPAVPLFLIALKNKGIKGGDVKYLSAVGAYFGITALAEILFFALVPSVTWSVIKKQKSVPLAAVIFIGYMMYSVWKRGIV